MATAYDPGNLPAYMRQSVAPLQLLHAQDDMLEIMEKDLIAKTAKAFEAAEVRTNVHGVFSLDVLEDMQEADLCRHIAIGIGYTGATPSIRDGDGRTGQNGGSSNAVKHLDFMFVAILAVPTGEQCNERHSATKLLSIMRRGILGTQVEGYQSDRKWMFDRELPNIGESDSSMLYYAQYWKLTVAQVGNV